MENFEYFFEFNGVRFQYSNSKKIKEREIHNYHEILFLIDGDFDLLTENGIYFLKSGSLLFIPSGTYHFLHLENSDSFKRLSVFFPDNLLNNTPLKIDKNNFIILEKPKKFLSLLEKLCCILTEPITKQNCYRAFTCFNFLLAELFTIEIPKTTPDEDYNFLSDIIEYINNNLACELSTSHLARTFNISESTLTHRFKKDYLISLHRYIIERRLFHARFLIKQGFLPTKIYSECGYESYSSFYRAYQKFFGFPPSKEKNHTQKYL